MPVQAPASEAVRRALLIGIDDYLQVPDLGGARNDVELIRTVLTKQLGFDQHNVRTLTNGEATRERMLAAMRELVAAAGPDDVVYLHFAGHGSQAFDASGDEVADQLDETLVPQDGRTPGVPDITDDELRAIFAELRAPTAILVFDSCHSGTVTRGAEVRTRSLPPDPRRELYAHPPLTTRGVVPLLEERYVLLTGAASNQTALDAPIDGRGHGLFTYSFARALADLGPEASPLELLEATERELARLKAHLNVLQMPEPQLEGPPQRLRAPLLPVSTASVARLPWLSVRSEGNASARLLDGVSLGAGAGSVWAVYPSGERDFLPGRAIARVVVERLDGRDALGVLRDASQLPEGARAVALLPPTSDVRLRVRWLAVSEDEKSALEEAIRKRVPQVQFVDGEQFSRLALEVTPEAAQLFGADGRSPVATLASTRPESLAADLAPHLERALRAAELLSLHNPASALHLRLEVSGRESPRAPVAEGTRSIRIVADAAAPRFRVRRPEEPRTPANSLQVQVTASRDCYLTLVDVDVTGRITPFFPNPLAEAAGFLSEGRIAARQPTSIPDSLEPGNRAGFYIDYAPPAGTDTILAVCAERPEAARTLREALARANDAAPGQATRSLREDLSRAASRGIVLLPAQDDLEGGALAVPSAPSGEQRPREDVVAGAVEQSVPSDWAAASLTIEVAE